MVFWLSTLLFVGCQTASTQVTQAVMLEQQGDSVAAFDIYKSILSQYPNTPEAKTSLRRIQRMQLKMAKSLETTDPKRSLALYQSMLDRWPSSEYGQLAKEKIATLTAQVSNIAPSKLPKEDSFVDKLTDDRDGQVPSPQDLVVENTIVDQAEFDACETAQKSQSRVVWQQYKKTFPKGACIEEAEEFLSTVAPRQMELDQAKAKTGGVKKALRAICNEYRLVQTTSNPNACDDPSRALMTEFARLQKRKSDLLASGEVEKKEYYEKWIPPRWRKLTTAEQTACAELVGFVDELAMQGIDRSAIETELAIVRTCFADQGQIE